MPTPQGNPQASEFDDEPLTNAVLQNQLAILDIQATDTLTAGTTANMFRDIYSDSGGYLNEVDTGNTTAVFNVDEYSNGFEETKTETGSPTDSTSLTLNGTAVETGIVTEVKFFNNGDTDTFTAKINQNSIELASKSAEITTGTSGTISFILGDYANEISDTTDSGNFDIAITRAGTGTIRNFTGQSDSTGLFTYSSQPFPNGHVKYKITNTDKIVQTNSETVSSPGTFQIFTWQPTTSGTGTITYDVSFNGGSNYQTGIEAGTETEITNTGSSLIVKQNLNAGASEGTAEAKGFGIMFW